MLLTALLNMAKVALRYGLLLLGGAPIDVMRNGRSLLVCWMSRDEVLFREMNRWFLLLATVGLMSTVLSLQWMCSASPLPPPGLTTCLLPLYVN